MNRLVLAVFLSLLLSIFALGQTTPAPAQAQNLQIINGPVVERTGPHGAVIAWTTNVGGSSVVHYGTDQNNLNQTAQAPYRNNSNQPNQTHRVRIHNLQPGTTYYFVVDSGEGFGTGTQAKSQVVAEREAGSAPAETLPIHAGFIDLPQTFLDGFRRKGEASELGRIEATAARLREAGAMRGGPLPCGAWPRATPSPRASSTRRSS